MMIPQANEILSAAHYGDVLYLFLSVGGLIKKGNQFPLSSAGISHHHSYTNRPWHSGAFSTLSPFCLPRSL